jgi:hypothetical protein
MPSFKVEPVYLSPDHARQVEQRSQQTDRPTRRKHADHAALPRLSYTPSLLRIVAMWTSPALGEYRMEAAAALTAAFGRPNSGFHWL